jgi:hypothetical protein
MLLRDKIVIKKTDGIIFLGIVVLVMVFRYASLDLPLDHDSGANAFFARQMIRGELLYDRFHTAHHLPAIYYTFELAFRIFGDHPLSPKILLIFWVIACAWLLFLLGRLVMNDFVGILSAVFFILTTSQDTIAGLTVEMEHFANLPMIAAVFLSILFLQKKSPAWNFVFVGMLSAICMLYKIIFVSPLAVAGAGILAFAWLERNEAEGWKDALRRFSWLSLGFAIPFALTAGYFISHGLWERFLLVFTLGFTYINNTDVMRLATLSRPFGLAIAFIGPNNVLLLYVGLIATAYFLWHSFRLRTMQELAELMLALWLVVTFAEIGIRGGGFVYYTLIAIPPLAFMAAAGINAVYHWGREAGKQPKYAAMAGVLLIEFVLVNFCFRSFDFYKNYYLYKTNRISYDHFITQIDKGWYTNIDEGLLTYLELHTSPQDFIYVWSEHVQLYYYADRLPPIDILWPSYVSATGPPQRVFGQNTKYIIVDPLNEFARPQWLLDGLAENYRLETVIDGQEIYARSAR